MTDIVLFPAHHWHLVWVTSYPSNCLSFLASSALYSLSFSMILIIIYSLILRPRLLLCFQVMYSFTEWFIGEGRGKREGKALRWKISKFHNFWVSETVPKFLGVLRPFPARWKHWAFVLFALFCNILWFSYILNCVDLWLVFHHYPRRKFLWKHKQETMPALKWDTANEQLPPHNGFCYLPRSCRVLQHLITSKNDTGKTKTSFSPSFPFTSSRLFHSEEEPVFSSQGSRFCDWRGNHECKTCQLNSIPQHLFIGNKPNLSTTEHLKSLD